MIGLKTIVKHKPSEQSKPIVKLICKVLTVVSIYFICGVGTFYTVDNFLNSPGIRQSIGLNRSDVSSLHSIAI